MAIMMMMIATKMMTMTIVMMTMDVMMMKTKTNRKLGGSSDK